MLGTGNNGESSSDCSTTEVVVGVVCSVIFGGIGVVM